MTTTKPKPKDYYQRLPYSLKGWNTAHLKHHCFPKLLKHLQKPLTPRRKMFCDLHGHLPHQNLPCQSNKKSLPNHPYTTALHNTHQVHKVLHSIHLALLNHTSNYQVEVLTPLNWQK